MVVVNLVDKETDWLSSPCAELRSDAQRFGRYKSELGRGARRLRFPDAGIGGESFFLAGLAFRAWELLQFPSRPAAWGKCSNTGALLKFSRP